MRDGRRIEASGQNSDGAGLYGSVADEVQTISV
jgi:hypothetical protein